MQYFFIETLLQAAVSGPQWGQSDLRSAIICTDDGFRCLKIKGGVSVGVTDELGSAAVENRLHVRNLHATVLHQMGFDPNRLTYFYGGLDQKLVGVEGAEPIRQII